MFYFNAVSWDDNQYNGAYWMGLYGDIRYLLPPNGPEEIVISVQKNVSIDTDNSG